ncbi:MAG: aminopeptidase P family protein [Lachnospiraceae bacterium]|nr:aminopeptidase P family protein [Lachnospiraceae bacterium]
MENELIQARLSALRKQMAEKKIDYYMIPTADFHNSEYVSDYFKVREYFSNFTGSNGTLVVWQEGAGLWTDGRYFIQAEKELEGTGITLYRMQDEGVPTIEEFLKEQMPEGGGLGFDGRTISAKQGRKYAKELQEKKICFVYEEDLAGKLWTDRPAFPAGKVYALPEQIVGKRVDEKLAEVREKVQEAGAEGILFTKLDDIMWLYNIRGCDVACNPVAMSYAYVDAERAVLFIQKEAIADCAAYFAKAQIEVRAYGEITDFLQKISQEKKILVDMAECSFTLHHAVDKAHLVEGKNPVELLKSMKNPVEIANMETIYLKDSVALTKFIYWVKTNIGKQEITEVSAAEKLEEFRREIPEFLDLSFPTIAGYGPNAAMMHYEATPEQHATLRPEGLFLVDSGGQYMGGTTDVTRTIVLGPITEEQRKHYTLTAIGMLRLTNARWIYGCSGRNLDILAREALWKIGIDYKCGTGHGVGYILNVHEEPINIRWRFPADRVETPIEEGMTVSNEPGVYIAGSHGIRIENVMVAKNDSKNEYGQFMHFDTLTWVPLDPAAIDLSLMPAESREQYARYQSAVYEKLAPYLTQEERDWLRQETSVC